MGIDPAHRGPRVVLVLDDRGRLDSRIVTVWDRLRARLLAATLDRQLAAGQSPDTSALLALRASALLSPQSRDDIACAFERLAEPWRDDERRNHLEGPRWSLNHAKKELSALAARMRSGPVAVNGVAQASVLLSDGAGPLYRPLREDSLELAARAVLDALDPWVA
jgi:hypothetical protein